MMIKKDYLSHLDTVVIDKAMVSQLEKKYDCVFPERIAQVISRATDTIFFEDDSRMLSFSEMLDAEKDLHTEFVKLGLLPLADCGENDFIVFHVKDGTYSVFNIIEECDFKRKDSLEALLK